jgi:GNAT superfamily N-acetyltransferase
MSLICRPMRPPEADAVATMLRRLPRDLGFDTVPKVTGQSLRDNADIIHVMVAEDSGLMLGACAWTLTFSTYRAARGAYVCDLYVMEHKRGSGIGEKLLRATAKESAKKGAAFLKLEASRENPKPGQFYTRHNFHFSEDDRLMFLEPDQFQTFIAGNAK